VRQLGIPGVEHHALEAHSDERGTLRELWRASVRPLRIRQVLVTSSAPRALRGMHYHLRQSDLCYVSAGAVFMALVDLRRPDHRSGALWLGQGESVLIPPGVAHGYTTEQGATVMYLLTEEVDGSDEFGFRFDDPAAAIQWPVDDPRLSARDREAGAMARAVAHVRAQRGLGPMDPVRP